MIRLNGHLRSSERATNGKRLFLVRYVTWLELTQERMKYGRMTLSIAAILKILPEPMERSLLRLYRLLAEVIISSTEMGELPSAQSTSSRVPCLILPTLNHWHVS